MAVICGPVTRTISYLSQSICGHIVKVYDIKPFYETIEVLIDGQQIIPGIGSVSVRIDNQRVNISLITKNVPAGTADIIFTLESIEAPPPVTATHHLDLYLKPYSWYSPQGVADYLLSNIAEINGRIINVFTGITGWQFVDSEIIIGEKAPDLITFRINLNQLSGMGVQSMALPAVLATIEAALVIAFLVVVISVALIVGYELIRYISNLVDASKQYTKADVHGMVWTNDKSVVKEQFIECEKDFSDPVQIGNCKKAVLCGAANGLTDQLELSGTDCETLGINEKVDACTAQYNIDNDYAKYKSCIAGVSKDAGTEINNKIPKEPMGWGILLLAGGLIGLVILSKGGSQEKRGE